MYKLIQDTNPTWNAIKRLSDNAVIPMDEANTDYIAYLAWIAEGNVPEEA